MKSEEMKGMEQEELNQLVQEGKMTWQQWMAAQPDTYGGYAEWLEENAYTDSTETALQYISLVDNENIALAGMDNQVDGVLKDVENVRRVLQE